MTSFSRIWRSLWMCSLWMCSLWMCSIYLSLILGDEKLAAHPTPAPQSETSSAPLSAQELSLVIWRAEISPEPVTGRSWDTASQPDPMISISRLGHLLAESETQKNTLSPKWGLVISPISLKEFEQGPLEITLIDRDLLRKQVIERFTLSTPRPEHIGHMLVIHGARVSTLYLQWNRLNPEEEALDISSEVFRSLEAPKLEKKKRSFTSSSHLRPHSRGSSVQTTPISSVEINTSLQSNTHASVRLEEMNRPHQALKLFRAYLTSYFEGDQIGTHLVLLQLALYHPETRYGRKARRILLLNAW